MALATRDRAQVPEPSDIGRLAVGMCADLAWFDLGRPGFAGAAVHDPVAAPLLCASPQAACTVVDGRVMVRQGRLQTVELAPLVTRHNTLAQLLAA